MKHLGVVIVVVAMAFGVYAMAQAPEEKTGPTKAERASITGKLTKIDGKVLTVTVAANAQSKESKEVVINGDDQTRVFRLQPPPVTAEEKMKEGPRRGQRTPAKFEDLKVGQQVRVFYNSTTNVAMAVLIVPEAAEAGSPASTASPQEK